MKKAAEKPRKSTTGAAPALRIFHPDASDEQAATPAKPAKTHAAKSAPDDNLLAKEVRRAMKLLQSGKADAAYRTLEKALAAGAE